MLKRNAPIKITVNINKKDGLVNGTFGYVCDTDKENGIIWLFSVTKWDLLHGTTQKKNILQ